MSSSIGESACALGFARLGEEVARRWRARNNEISSFAEIAASSLADSGLIETIATAEIARWFLGSGPLPEQRGRPVAQPSITVYNGAGFFIELLIWVDVPTSIHQHNFAGAFGVLRGSSVHTRYRFAPAERLSPQLALGDLQFASSELLQHGDIRAIEPGDRLIHALLHQERPSISLVVRTPEIPEYEPSLRYLPPGLAFDTNYSPQPIRTQVNFFRTLATTDPALFRELAEQTIATGDIWLAYKVIQIAAIGAHSATAALLKALRKRHAGFADVLAAAMLEKLRHDSIMRAMQDISHPEHRYLLAMLFNAPNRAVIDQLIKARFPDADPEEKIVEAVSALSAAGHLNFGRDERSLSLLRFALRGASLKDAARALGERFGDDSETQAATARTWYQIKFAGLLKPLMQGASTEQPLESVA
jgi:hypothetical protein